MNIKACITTTDIVENTLQAAQYASICFSEKGHANRIVKTEQGHDVICENCVARFVRAQGWKTLFTFRKVNYEY